MKIFFRFLKNKKIIIDSLGANGYYNVVKKFHILLFQENILQRKCVRCKQSLT